MSLSDFFVIIRRNLWMLIVGALMTAVPIMVIILRQPPAYSAEAMIRLIDQRAAMVGGITDPILGRNADAILSQLEVLRGRRVIGEVVDDLGLRVESETVAFPFSSMEEVRVDSTATATELRLSFHPDGYRIVAGNRTANGIYGRRVAIGGVSFVIPERPVDTEDAVLEVLPREAAIDELLDRLDAIPRERTDAVAVTYTAADPATAQRVTNAIIETFQYANASTAQQESRRQRIFLEGQLAEADSVLRGAEGTLSAFRSDQQFFSSREMVTAQQASLLDLEQQRALLDSERLIYTRLLTELTEGGEQGQAQALQALVSSPGMAANPVVSTLYSQLSAARQQRDSLVSTGAVGESVQSLDNLIRTTQTELIGAIRSHMTALSGQIAALGDLRGQRAAQMSTLPQIEVEELRLTQQVEAVRAVTSELTAELQRARMSEAVEVGQVQVVYEAPLPLEPASNGLIWKVGLGLMLGMLLGSGGALLRDSLNTSIREPDEIVQSLGLPELAVVPHALQAENRGRPGGREIGRIGPPGRPDLAILQGTGAIGAEAYRMLRTNLLYAQARDGLSTLVVTSPAPGEGKTTTVANLAVAFAQQGQRVLLLDCDLRRPRLHKVFGADQGPGLSDVLTGDSLLRDVLRATQVDELTLITAGSTTDSPAELLSSDRMDQLVKFLAEGFDLVLLDTPPVLAAAEAMSLSTLVDGVVLVLRAGQTDRRDALHAVKQLTDVGAEVFGAVLNDPDATMSRYGGGYKYYKYYSGAAS